MPVGLHGKSLLVLAFTLLLVISIRSLGPEKALGQPKPAYVVPELDYGRIEDAVDTISSFGPRVTGYEGYQKTLEYLYSYFGELGFRVINHTYKVLVPFEEESYIEVVSPFSARIRAYALWPNSVQTSSVPPEGIEGRLIYVGSGDLESFDGKEVEGSIVVMDFNSGENWLTAAKLGARAVIFVEPDSTTYYEAEKKFLDTPLYFPRLYVSKSDWEALRKADRVKIYSKIYWKEIKTVNLIAVINGSLSSDVVILSTHFDSWSVVPSLAASKVEAIPAAVLMEYARYLKEKPPRYTVWLVFFSGHWQALAGSREFVEKFFFSRGVQEGQLTIWGMINLDMLASDGDGIQFLHASYYTMYGGNPLHGGGFPARLSWFMSKIPEIVGSEKVSSFVSSELGTADPLSLVNIFFSTTGFWGTEPIPYMLDSEPASMSGLPAFSITSRRSSRNYVGVPTDDGQYADIDRLRPYISLVIAVVDGLLRVEWDIDRSTIAPTRFQLSAPRGYPGYITFFGRVVVYNFTKGWYDPVPRALVEIQVIGSTYKLNKIIMRADEHGKFIVHGIPQAGRGAYGGTTIPFSQWIIRGWYIDPSTGQITMAPDLGQFGVKNFPQLIIPLHPYENVTAVIMKAYMATIFDVELPPNFVTSNIRDPRTGYFDWWRRQFILIQPFELLTKGIPVSFGSYANGWEPVALVWVPPGTVFSIVGYTAGGTAQQPAGGGRYTRGGVFLLLTNSSEEDAEGSGFYAAGKPLTLTFTAYNVAKDFYLVSSGRYRKFVERYIGSPSADLTLKKAYGYLKLAAEAYGKREYSRAYGYALLARAYGYMAYNLEVMPLINDASRSVLFLFPLAIFGAFFLEKILIHSDSLKRILWISIVAGIVIEVFSILHPAFSVIANIALGFLGSIITIVLLVTIVVLGAEGEEVRKKIERRILGVHRVEVSRMDTAMMAFSLGSEYIRKRPFRSALMLFTIMVMAMALTSFTSFTPVRASTPVLRYGFSPSYDGILLKEGRGVPPGILTDDVVRVAEVIVGDRGRVFPRVWVYPPVDRGYLAATFAVHSSTGRNITVAALLGIKPSEFELLLKNVTIGPGIVGEEANMAVISSSMAQNLSVTVGDEIFLLGQRFVVSGIIEATDIVENTLEPDGYNMLPADPAFFASISKDLTVAAQAGSAIPNVGVSRTVIIPYRTALKLGGYVASISVRLKEPKFENLVSVAEELALATDLIIYLSSGGAPFRMSTFTSFFMGGWEMVVVILVIGALNVSVVVLGNLKERTREIYVFSAVGMSPMAVAVFFAAETLVYVITGTMLGYLAGFGTTQLLIAARVLPPGHVFNFASAFTLLGLAAVIASSLAAIAYPSFVASRIITPSLERRWRLKTRPKGDEWEIVLPISVPSVEEARGLLEYIYEYYMGAGAVKEGVYIVRGIEAPDQADLTLRLSASIAPFEAGISQEVELSSVLDRRINRYVFRLYLKRLSGPRNMWIDSNYRFIDDVRKQLLLWGSLPASERKKYIALGSRRLSKS